MNENLLLFDRVSNLFYTSGALSCAGNDQMVGQKHTDSRGRYCAYTFQQREMAMEPRDTPTTVSIDSINRDASRRSPSGVALERHYSVGELAKLWELSENTIRRIFNKEPGVLQLVHEETRFKRGYTTLRVPESVVQRVHRRLQGIA